MHHHLAVAIVIMVAARARGSNDTHSLFYLRKKRSRSRRHVVNNKSREPSDGRTDGQPTPKVYTSMVESINWLLAIKEKSRPVDAASAVFQRVSLLRDCMHPMCN
jgi:hypothetical protein